VERVNVAGVGIGLRREFHDAILRTERQIDWLEVVSENFMGLHGRPRFVLDACLERWPIIPHGVTASVGTKRLDAYDDALAELMQRTGSPYFSDHLCYTSLAGHESFDLLPLPFTHESIDAVAARASEVRARVGKSMLLENISYYAIMPGSQMQEHAFLVQALEASGCGLLLDLNNLYLNARNHGEDPQALLARIPFGKVGQIHLAGHIREGDILLDTHSRAIADEVWALYRETLKKTGPVPTLIEWDQQIPSLDAVLDEADKARAVMNAVCTAQEEGALNHDASV
jgi:uncharacterized protein